ncbi:N-acetylglucosamine-6-phosphate deacetylase [Morganella morganii]|uniref:N-acetylglucosamine-6-phosphate deacetylase n=1 Tax=Morganella morganii TaxID=582 RepID=UPI001BDA3EF2|nr:amidohydrolase family protein [Morganella morganii]MBT0520806.1 amidohydrolase family protein [Morganella morganii subsp. morganii]QWL91424.1 amidohydrolase family protein [Morganella morganii subsp. morganii]
MLTQICGKTLNGKPVTITADNGVITTIEPLITDTPENLPYVAAGLVDLQVNGYAGTDYNTLPLHRDDVRHSYERLYQKGVTSLCPTVITNSDEAISQLMADFAGFCAADPRICASTAGIHLEGPFISPVSGPRGAHDKACVQHCDIEKVRHWHSVSQGLLRILTLSPEQEDGLADTIRFCTENNIRVSVGHTAATPEQIRRAAELGATMSTHLGNGCELQMHRHNNPIWAQLAEDSLWSGIITDGFHLPPSLIKVILLAKQGKILLTSDTTAFGGMAPGRYHTHIGGDVVLTEQGRLHLAANEELLAGSAQSALECISFLIRSGLSDAEQAWRYAAENPAAFLGLTDRGTLAAGKRADIVVLDIQGSTLQVLETYLQGEAVYRA